MHIYSNCSCIHLRTNTAVNKVHNTQDISWISLHCLDQAQPKHQDWLQARVGTFSPTDEEPSWHLAPKLITMSNQLDSTFLVVIMGDLIFWIQTKHHTEFSINSRFNTRLNLKDKVTLEFGIILSLTLIVSQQISLKLNLMLGFKLKFIWGLI